MTNKEISRFLKLTAALGELHDENPFKIKSLNNGAFQVDRVGFSLVGKTVEELSAIPGIGKGIAVKIAEFVERGTTEELDHFLLLTPPGVVELLSVKGIGPKKVGQLWKELEIESPGELLYACYENRLVELKGFGVKTQDSIRQGLEFKISSNGKLHFAEAETVARELIRLLKLVVPGLEIENTGELRRKLEVIEELELIAVCKADELVPALNSMNELQIVSIEAERICIQWTEKYALSIQCCALTDYSNLLFKTTGPAGHVLEIGADATASFTSETSIYQSVKSPFVIPELRDLPLKQAQLITPESLVTWKDIRGVLHNHSTYSDGADTLATMAEYAKGLGFAYLGMCDHSRSAFYAGGLPIDKVLAQHLEIDQLNSSLEPFKVFKGIESDILNDGSLDYPEDILKTFDFIVASVHSVLRMDEEKANKRLIKAIENPYTRILGHPTGRLLLSRKGYPIDHKLIIDACAANNVVVELNAHPYRLDIDWRWIPYCLEKGVMISVNPDAHKKEGYHDMQYGINVARKGGLTPDCMLNAMSLDQFSAWISSR
jgi:DNA polymerase (family 10)